MAFIFFLEGVDTKHKPSFSKNRKLTDILQYLKGVILHYIEWNGSNY